MFFASFFLQGQTALAEKLQKELEEVPVPDPSSPDAETKWFFDGMFQDKSAVSLRVEEPFPINLAEKDSYRCYRWL